MNAVFELLHSKKPAYVIVRWFFLVVLVLMAVFSLLLSVLSLFPVQVYQKDFIQEYLLARAVLTGVDPYLPLPELSKILMGELPVGLLPHPLPHPPPAVLLALPFGLLSYETSAAAWFIFEIICIGAAVFLLVRYLFPNPRAVHFMGAAVLVLIWSPVKDELVVGQWMSVLLLLLVLAWLLFRKNKDIAGGLLIGLVVALKLTAWPVVLFLVLRRRWKAVFAAGGAVLAAHLVSGLLMGFDRLWFYYTEVGGQVTLLYRAHERNFSVWSIGYRLFEGTGSTAGASISAPPLVSLPLVAPVIGYVLMVLLLSVCLYLSVRASDFDISVGILVCASMVINPVAWSHYLVMALLPVAVLLRQWRLNRLTNVSIRWTTIVLLLLFLGTGIRGLILLVSGHGLNLTGPVTVPFAAALFSLVPLAVVLGLMGMLAARTSGYADPQAG